MNLWDRQNLVIIAYMAYFSLNKEVGGILKFQRVHKSPPLSSPILPKDDS